MKGCQYAPRLWGQDTNEYGRGKASHVWISEAPTYHATSAQFLTPASGVREGSSGSRLQQEYEVVVCSGCLWRHFISSLCLVEAL